MPQIDFFDFDDEVQKMESAAKQRTGLFWLRQQQQLIDRKELRAQHQISEALDHQYLEDIGLGEWSNRYMQEKEELRRRLWNQD